MVHPNAEMFVRGCLNEENIDAWLVSTLASQSAYGFFFYFFFFLCKNKTLWKNAMRGKETMNSWNRLVMHRMQKVVPIDRWGFIGKQWRKSLSSTCIQRSFCVPTFYIFLNTYFFLPFFFWSADGSHERGSWERGLHSWALLL